MTNPGPKDTGRNRIIATAKAEFGGTGQTAVAKAAGVIFYDPAMEAPKNIEVIHSHLRKFPFEDPKSFAEKAYLFAKKRAEEEIIAALKKGPGRHEYLDGSKAASAGRPGRKAPRKPLAEKRPPARSAGSEPAPQSPSAPVSPAPPEEKPPTVAEGASKPEHPGASTAAFMIKPGLTSLGITAEATFHLVSTPGNPLQIKKAVGLSPRLDPKRKELRIVSGMGLLEGVIKNGGFAKDGSSVSVSKNGREVHVIDLPGRVGILLSRDARNRLPAWVAEILVNALRGLEEFSEKSAHEAVRQAKARVIQTGKAVPLKTELKLMIFPVPPQDKTLQGTAPS